MIYYMPGDLVTLPRRENMMSFYGRVILPLFTTPKIDGCYIVRDISFVMYENDIGIILAVTPSSAEFHDSIYVGVSSNGHVNLGWCYSYELKLVCYDH